MEIRDFKQLYEETTAYHVHAADLLRNRDGTYLQYMNMADRGYRELLRTEPNDPHLLFLRGTLDLQNGDSGRAIALLEKCVRIKPDLFDAWNNLGAAWRQEHRNAEAAECYHKALEIKPDEPDVLANLCAMMVNEGRPEEGIPYGERCLQFNPDHPQGTWNLGLLYLETENYQKGFEHYNLGVKTGDRITRKYVDKRGIEVPYWTGAEKGGTIVLYGEQGQGDELLWMQFAPYVRERFDRIILDCHPKLVHAIKRSYPWATVYPTRKTEPQWASTEEIHYKQSIASLPFWFHEKRRENAGWLKPDAAKVAQVREMIKFGQRKLGQKDWPIIGIHWIGGKHKTRADLRSVFLPEWERMMDRPVTMVSQQYTPDAYRDIREYSTRILHWQALCTSPLDYDWNLALAAACDLTITVNTSAVHGCGSMNIPCWTMTPYGHAWRYGRAKEPNSWNPFYKSVYQFNQQEEESWSDVMTRVLVDLDKWLEERK